MNWFKQLFNRHRLHQDLSDEIREHIEEKTEELIAAGMTREEAAAAARREFGNVLLQEERSREVWRWSTLENVLTDSRHAIRHLRKAPGFTVLCLLTLTLGIGANAAMFSVVDSLFFRTLPYPHPERLAALVKHLAATTKSGTAFSEDDNSHDGETWELVRDNVPAVKAAVYANLHGVNLQTDASVRYVEQQRVSAHYFEVLGITPLVGRSFTEEEDRPQGPKAVLLSYDLWQSAFSLDQQVLDKTVLLKGEPHTVVGVLPPHTQTPFPADLWVPLQPSRSGEGSGSNFGMYLRLNDGMTWSQANAQLRQLRPSMLDGFMKFNKDGQSWLAAIPLQQDLARSGRLPAIILMSAVALILLIACADLAGLMLVRVIRRAPEIATRLALGATRAAILRQVMVEPLLLVAIGGSAGLLLAVGILDFLRKFLSPQMLPFGVALDFRVTAFALAVSLCTVLLIGILPANEASRVDLRTSMGGNSSRTAGQAGRARTRQFLIAGEVTLSVVLLAGAGLLIRTLVNLQTLPPGFDPTNVLTAQVSLDDARYHTAPAFRKLLNTSIAAMKRIPGVESAAVGLSLPYERGLNTGIRIADGAKSGEPEMSSALYVTPEYFQALRIPVLQGRAFTDADTADTQLVAMVNVSFASRYLGGRDVVGRHLKATSKGPTLAIVGLVADVAKRPGLMQNAPLVPSEPTYYLPATQVNQDLVNLAHTWFHPSWIVRTRGPIQGLAAAMQTAFAEADPSIPFVGVYEMQELQNKALDRQRMEVFLLSALAGLALVLSIIGVYGLVSNLVTQRTREIGIRMALGSTLKQAMIEIGKSGVTAAASGIGAGLGLSALIVRLIKAELYGVQPYDPVTFLVCVVLLLSAALIASLAPTARIARIDPASTLRAE